MEVAGFIIAIFALVIGILALVLSMRALYIIGVNAGLDKQFDPKSNTVPTPAEVKIDTKNNKVVKPPKPSLSNWQRAELLDNFHKEHGNFKDVDEYVQNEEQNEKTRWHKSKNVTEEEYHQRMEARIDDLMAKIENKEIELSDLSKEDQKIIKEINQQKNDG